MLDIPMYWDSPNEQPPTSMEEWKEMVKKALLAETNINVDGLIEQEEKQGSE